MTLKKPTRLSSPVFDTTPSPTGSKSFLTRRLISLSGRPLLAEKHLPIKPSASEISRKCYSTSAAKLYKFRTDSDQTRQFKPHFQFAGEEPITFENHPILLFATPKYAWKRPTFAFSSPPSFSCNNCHSSLILADTVHLPTNHLEYSHKSYNSLPEKAAKKTFLARAMTISIISTSEARMGRIFAPAKATTVAPLSSPVNQCAMQKVSRAKRFTVLNISLASCSNYRPVDYNFTSTSFLSRVLPVKPQIKKISEGQSELRYSLMPALKLQHFKTSIQPVPANFAPTNEINENFILESKVSFKAACNNRLGQPQKSINMRLEHKCHSCEQHALAQSASLFWPETLTNLPLLATAKIATSKRQTLTFTTPLQINTRSRISENECIFNNSGRYTGQSGKMRLKLRLCRQPFASREAIIKPQVSRSFTPIEHISRPFIATTYIPLKRAVNWSPDCKHQYCNASFFKPQAYLQKRSHFFIKSTIHARYTLKALRKIHFNEAFDRTKALKLSIRNWKLYYRAIKPVLPLTFPVKKLLLETLSGKFACKPFSLKVFANKPVFDDIQLPLQKRRIQTIAGNFNSNLHCEQLKRRKKSLRMLRFKLEIIKEGFQSKPEKGLRRLTCQQRPFSMVLFAEKPAKLAAVERITTCILEKPLQTVTQILLKKATIRQKLSVHLQVMLPLADMQVRTDLPATLTQKSFIVPSLWKPTGKAFSCKLRLLPHPFGFPDFRLLPPRFICLVSPVRFAAADIPTEMANFPGNFVLKREKVYLPPTSMKNPRKLLYNSVSQANSPREFYVSHKDDLTSELYPPPAIESFNYPWKTSGARNTVKAGFAFKQSNSNRQKSIVLIAKHLLDAPTQYLDVPYGSPAFKMPTIKKMLLRARRFVAAKKHHEPCLNAVFRHIKTTFKHGQPDVVQSSFRKYEFGFGLFRIKDSFFSQNFSTDKPVPVYEKALYRARFRALRFPYRPEIAALKTTAENFCNNDQLPPSQGCDFVEDSRANEFAFQMPGIGWSLPSSTDAIDLKPVATEVSNFKQINLAPYSQAFLNKAESPLPKLDDFTPNLYHCINPDTFFRFYEKAGMRLKKAIRSYNFKHLDKSKILPPSTAMFSEFGLKNAPDATLPMNSLHWIILLRSYINLDTPLFNYISEPVAQIAPPTFACPKTSAKKPYQSCDMRAMVAKHFLAQEFTKNKLGIKFQSCERKLLNLFSSFTGQRVKRDCDFTQHLLFTHCKANFVVPEAHEIDQTRLEKKSFDHFLLKKSESLETIEKHGKFMITEQKSQAGSIMLPTRIPVANEMFKHANIPDWIDLMSLTCAGKDIRIL